MLTGAEGRSGVGIVSEQNKLFRNWGACVDSIFSHVSRMVILRGEGGRFERNQKMHSIEIGRWSPSDGPEEYASKMLTRPLWYSADGELPMKSRKEKRIWTLRES